MAGLESMIVENEKTSITKPVDREKVCKQAHFMITVLNKTFNF